MSGRDTLKAPKLGWYCGQVNGKKWFSDGCFMAEGERNSKRKPLNPKSMQRCYRRANRKLVPVIFIGTHTEGPDIFNLRVAKFSNGTLIQQKYFDYFRKDGEFFVGPQCGESKQDRFVIVKRKKKIVAVIMPVRAAA